MLIGHLIDNIRIINSKCYRNVFSVSWILQIHFRKEAYVQICACLRIYVFFA